MNIYRLCHLSQSRNETGEVRTCRLKHVHIFSAFDEYIGSDRQGILLKVIPKCQVRSGARCNRDHSRWNKWLLVQVPNDQFKLCTAPSLTQGIRRVIFSIIPKIIGSHQLTWHFAFFFFFYLNKTEKELSSGSNKIFLQQAKHHLVLFGAVEDSRWARIFIYLTEAWQIKQQMSISRGATRFLLTEAASGVRYGRLMDLFFWSR